MRCKGYVLYLNTSFPVKNCVLLVGTLAIIGVTRALRQTPPPQHILSSVLNLVTLVMLRVADLPVGSTDPRNMDIQLGPCLRLTLANLIVDGLGPALTTIATIMFVTGCFALLLTPNNA